MKTKALERDDRSRLNWWLQTVVVSSSDQSLSARTGVASGALVYPKASNGHDGSRKPYHPFLVHTTGDKGRISCLIGMHSEIGRVAMCEALGGGDKRVEH